MCDNADGVVVRSVFYEVFPDMSPDEIKKYKHYAGISPDSRYEEILQDLKARASKEAK
ncbi:MAG: hypothetical protein U0L98_04740 [Clostridia bacterium]|nr:hypothetical protein [Clostridia bacterium]